jgi:predicted ABC-type ATPase
MVGGAPANGKSAFIRNGPVAYPENILKIDPDEIKAMLPEYRHLLKMNEPGAALIVHEESSRMAEKLRQVAIEEEIDLLLDGVANHSLAARMEDLRALKNNGHWARMDYVTLDTTLSLQVARIRFQRTGRRILEDLIRKYNRNLATVPQLIDNHVFDELHLWDTNIAVKPRLILTQKNRDLKMINSILYENFKRKAYE